MQCKLRHTDSYFWVAMAQQTYFERPQDYKYLLASVEDPATRSPKVPRRIVCGVQTGVALATMVHGPKIQ
jgi:hypothetical protein